MQLLIISLLFISGFSFLGIITLSWAIFDWEKRKIDGLMNADNRGNQSTGYTSPSFNFFNNINSNVQSNPAMNNTKEQAAKVAQNVSKTFSRTLVIIKETNYSSGFAKIVEKIKDIGSNFWLYSKLAANYLMKLNKNSAGAEVVDEEQFQKDEKAKQDVAETVQRVASIKDDKKSDILDVIDLEESVVIDQSRTDKDSFATLNMASSTRSDVEQTIFEKLENSILEKLQAVGLNNYGIWIELAKLYEKYNENQKAVEIYAMVLKHASGLEKDFARDKLIALS